MRPDPAPLYGLADEAARLWTRKVPALADDLRAAGRLGAWLAVLEFRKHPDRPLDRLTYVCARREVVEVLRGEFGRYVARLRVALDAALPAAGPTPEEAAAASELLARLPRALAELPARERAVVEACDFADKPVRGQATPRLRVVADALGVSEPSVCRIRRAALERMREALAT